MADERLLMLPFLWRHALLILSVLPPIFVFLSAYDPRCFALDESFGKIPLYLCIALTAYRLEEMSWALGTPYISVQLFHGMASTIKSFVTLLFQFILPTGLFAALIKKDDDLEFDLRTVIAVVYYFMVSFSASFYPLYVYRLLRAKWRFERSQDTQHYTRDVWILYSGRPNDNKELSLAQRKANELAENPAFHGTPFYFACSLTFCCSSGFSMSVMSLDEVNAAYMVSGGALLILFVLDRNDLPNLNASNFTGRLRDEAEQR